MAITPRTPDAPAIIEADTIDHTRPGASMDDAVLAIFEAQASGGEDEAIHPAGDVEPHLPDPTPDDDGDDTDEPIAAETTDEFAAVDPFATPTPSIVTPEPTETIDFFGQKLTQAEGTALLEAYQFLSSLTPEQIERVSAAVSDPATPSNPQTPPRNPTQPQPLNIDAILADDPDADPQIVALQAQISAMSAQIAETQQLTQQQIEQQQQQDWQRQAYENAQRLRPHAERATQAFQQKYELSDADIAVIHAKAQANEAIIDAAYAQTQNEAQAYYSAFETILWADPELRQRAIEASTRSTLDAQNAVNAKRARAGSLAGSGGSIPRTAPVANTPADRQSAIVDELRAAMSRQ